MSSVIKRYSGNRKILILISALLIAASLSGAIFVITNRSDDTQTSQIPQYDTVLPHGKSIGQLGGWKRVSPPNTSPVYSYTDLVEKVIISVSQQPLPDSFKGEPELQTSKLAESYSATTKFDANGTTVYLGTSALGPQSVIFTKDNLLILIKSQNKISENAWKSYVQALK